MDALERVHIFETGQYESVRSYWDEWSEILFTDKMPIVQRLLIVLGIVVSLALFAILIWMTRRKRNEMEELDNDIGSDERPS